MKNKILNNVTNVKNIKLKNGIPVSLIPMPNSLTSSARITFDVGSGIEGKGKEGIAHFIEHLMLTDLWRDLYNFGGLVNGGTTKKQTYGFIEKLSQEAFTPALELLLHSISEWILLNKLPTTEEKFELEKVIVNTEIRGNYSTSSTHIESLVSEAYFGKDNPWGHHPLGSEENINNITLEDVSYYIENYFQKAGILLSISGNFNEDEVLALLDKYLSNYPYNPIDFPVLPPVPIIGEYSLVFPTNGFSGIYYAFPFFNETLSNPYLTPVFERIFRNVLFDELRVKRGLIYDLAILHPYIRDIFILPYSLATSCNLEHTIEVLNLMDTLMIHNPIRVSEVVLNSAKKQMIADQLELFSSNDPREIGILYSKIFKKEIPEELEKIIELINSITLTEVQDIFDNLNNNGHIRGVVSDKEIP